MTRRPTKETTAGQCYLALQREGRRTGRPTDELIQLYALEGLRDTTARPLCPLRVAPVPGVPRTTPEKGRWPERRSAPPDSVRREEVLHRGDRRPGRFLHQPVAGVRYNDFLNVRRRVAHDDPHVAAEGLLGADGDHRHRQLRLPRLEVVGPVLLVDGGEQPKRGMDLAW